MQKKIFTLFWQEAIRYPWRVALSLVGAVLTVLVASFAGPYIISIILNSIQNGDALSAENSTRLLLLYLATQLYGEVLGWRLNLYFAWSFQTRAQKNIHVKVFKHLMHQSTKFHANTFGGSLVSQTNKLSAAFERFWDNVIFDLLPSITSVVAAVTILSFVLWQYAIFIAIMSVCFVLVVYFGSRFMQKRNIHESQASTKQTGSLADAMANILAIKSHGQEDFETKKYYDVSHHWQSKSEKTMWGFLKISTGYATLTALLNTGAVLAALLAVHYTAISVAAVYLCISYTFTVARQLWEMNNIMRNYNRIIGDAHDMIIILDTEPEVKNIPNPEEVHIASGEIMFKDVSFGYEDGAKNNLLFTKLNLHIKPGEKVGLVGLSGGGKTTITKLLLRFMDITGGEILIDGQNIAKLNQSEFRKHIAYVPQEPLLFHRTLKENISYGSENNTDQAIISAAKMAHAHEFITALPGAYETLVGERGVKLSGGQRQRIAIARAMLKESPILLLDEATSALDSESEVLIQEALWKLMEGRTAIVIAHRLSTIQKMDRIIVLDKGAVAEEGSHTELLKKHGVYAKLWKHQSGGFIEE